MAEVVKKEEHKEHKLQNYFILLLIFVLCIGLSLYLCQLYKIEKEEEKKIPVIIDSLSDKIFYDELDSYIMDNPTKIIYMCTANDDSCRLFEKKNKKLLEKNKNDIVYLNLTGLDKDTFVKEFNEKYPYKKGLKTSFPAFVVLEDGRVKSILQGSAKKELDKSKVKVFLELNGTGE